jgi:hypothetical protein
MGNWAGVWGGGGCGDVWTEEEWEVRNQYRMRGAVARILYEQLTKDTEVAIS